MIGNYPSKDDRGYASHDIDVRVGLSMFEVDVLLVQDGFIKMACPISCCAMSCAIGFLTVVFIS